jgi:diadenosine tetraphosphate (Ap4A) HIT family hydrolase
VPEDREDLSVTDLLRRERESGAGAMDAAWAKNIVRAGTKYKGGELAAEPSGLDEDDSGAFEAAAAAATDPNARLTARERQHRDMQRAVNAHNKVSAALGRCPYCFDNPDIKKHLIVALGEYSYLALPPGGEAVPGHVILVPLPHIVAMTDADEEVYAELNRFKAALASMYAARGEDAVFLETATQFGKRRHTRIDVVPMDKELAFDAPLFFRKAIQDSEEWTTNKVLVDTAGKGLRGAIPKGFAYFHVGWQGGGFVHPVEDEEAWPPGFGMDVATGMMGRDPGSFGRKAAKRTFDQERRAVLDFLKEWEPFDWTRDLDGGDYAAGGGEGGGGSSSGGPGGGGGGGNAAGGAARK